MVWMDLLLYLLLGVLIGVLITKELFTSYSMLKEENNELKAENERLENELSDLQWMIIKAE